MNLAASHVSGTCVVASGGLFVVLLRRLWRVQVVAAAHRKRRRGQRAWVELVDTWHTPLLLLGLAIAAARVAFFAEIHFLSDRTHSVDPRVLRWRRWFWLELPSALSTITSAYLLFFHAHVALYRVWPIRLGSTSLSFRVLLGGFATLLLLVVGLLASGRESEDPILTSSEWTRLSLKYFAFVWIVLGALLLKFHGQSADVMWAERGAGRLLVVSPRGLHLLAAAEALMSLTLVARGVISSTLVIETEDPTSEPLLPTDPAKMRMTTFLSVYGIWELVTLGVIYCLCGCVPVYSRARRLVGSAEGPANGIPFVASQPVLHFAVPSPKQAVQDYIRSATAVLQSHTRISSRHFDESSMYDPPVEIGDDDEDDLLLEAESFHEPLLSSPTEELDAVRGIPCDRRRSPDPLYD